MRVRLFKDRPEAARALAQRWLAPGGKLFVEYDEPGSGPLHHGTRADD